jgi:hypothetical protein
VFNVTNENTTLLGPRIDNNAFRRVGEIVSPRAAFVASQLLTSGRITSAFEGPGQPPVFPPGRRPPLGYHGRRFGAGGAGEAEAQRSDA